MKSNDTTAKIKNIVKLAIRTYKESNISPIQGMFFSSENNNNKCCLLSAAYICKYHLSFEQAKTNIQEAQSKNILPADFLAEQLDITQEQAYKIVILWDKPDWRILLKLKDIKHKYDDIFLQPLGPIGTLIISRVAKTLTSS